MHFLCYSDQTWINWQAVKTVVEANYDLETLDIGTEIEMQEPIASEKKESTGSAKDSGKTSTNWDSVRQSKLRRGHGDRHCSRIPD